MHFEDLDGLESIVLGTADSASMRTRNALMSIFRGTGNGSDSVARASEVKNSECLPCNRTTPTAPS